MANIPIPENDDSLELNVRYQPDMVLEGMLDATVPEMKYLRLSQGNETHDLLGAQSGDQILELLSEDLTSAEEGKVLTVVEDNTGDTPVYNAEWAEIPDQLPTIASGDAGKILTVNVGETGAVWADAPSGLPEITAQDEGKVLTVVDNSGTLEAEWAEPSGGGGYDIQREISFTMDASTGQIDTASVSYAVLVAEIQAWYDPVTNPNNDRYYAKVNVSMEGYGTQTFVAEGTTEVPSLGADPTIRLLDATPIVLSAPTATIVGTTASWSINAVELYGWSAENLPSLGAVQLTVTGTVLTT